MRFRDCECKRAGRALGIVVKATILALAIAKLVGSHSAQARSAEPSGHIKSEDDAVDGQGVSRARDHLANERTYLAWLRTAGTVMVLGLAIVKFGEDSGSGNEPAIAAGIVLVAVGALGIVEGAVRYRRINREIEQGHFTTGSRGREPVIAGIVLILALVVALILVLV